MSKLEKMLGKQPLDETRQELDERIKSLFADEAPAITRKPLALRPWQLAAAATMCIGIGFGISRMTQPSPIEPVETAPEAQSPFTTIYFMNSDPFEDISAAQPRDALFGGKTIEPVITLGEQSDNFWGSEIVVIVNSENRGEVL